MRHHTCLLQYCNVNFIYRQLVERRQSHLGRITPTERNESTLWQPPMQRHLAALEANLVKAARTRLLSLVAAPGRLAESTADAAADTLFRVLGSRRRFNLVQTHLGLALHQITYLVDHAAHRGSIFQLNGVVNAPQAKAAHGGAMAFSRANDAADQRDLDGLAGFFCGFCF